MYVRANGVYLWQGTIWWGNDDNDMVRYRMAENQLAEQPIRKKPTSSIRFAEPSIDS